MKKYLLIIIIGLVFGLVFAKYLLVNSALSLIPWAIAALIIGYTCKNLKESIGLGSMYGFILAYTFMLLSYSGSEPIVNKLLPFIPLGIVGLAFGMIFSVLGYYIFVLLGHRKESRQN